MTSEEVVAFTGLPTLFLVFWEDWEDLVLDFLVFEDFLEDIFGVGGEGGLYLILVEANWT